MDTPSAIERRHGNELHLMIPGFILPLVHDIQCQEEPLHWSLFVARGNEPGFICQATEDAEYMQYESSYDKTNVVKLDDV